jgi:AcrR family transcriptional regulator
MTSSDRTRRSIMDAAYVQFRRKGYYRVSVDEIAAAAKITKRTLYYHFESKDELLAAVLQSQHEAAYRQFQDFGLRPGTDPVQIIDAIFAELSVWSARPGWTGPGFTRLAMELADLPGHPARKVARHHKASMERQLADVLSQQGVEDAETRAREIWVLLEGAMSLTLIHNHTAYIESAASAARELVQRSAPPRRRKNAQVPPAIAKRRKASAPRIVIGR